MQQERLNMTIRTLLIRLAFWAVISVKGWHPDHEDNTQSVAEGEILGGEICAELILEDPLSCIRPCATTLTLHTRCGESLVPAYHSRYVTGPFDLMSPQCLSRDFTV